MKRIETTIRILFGVMLLTFGANKFLSFMAPPAMPEEAMKFMMSIMDAGYIMPIIGAVFLVSGVMLIANKKKGFALILLAPIILNILLFHLRFAPEGSVMSIGMTIVLIYLMFANRSEYASLYSCKK